nr:exosortase/archaeosortase family protein [Salinibacter ruber]
MLYDLWLLPDGRLDRWVSISVVQVGEAALRVVGLDAVAQARNLSLSGTSGIRVVDGCNGLASIGLFVGFVVAYPGHAWRRALFIPLGILVVYLSNVGRVSGLLLLQKYWGTGFDVAHSVGAPMFFYTVIFGLWVLWANYGGSESAASTDADEQTQAAFA